MSVDGRRLWEEGGWVSWEQKPCTQLGRNAVVFKLRQHFTQQRCLRLALVASRAGWSTNPTLSVPFFLNCCVQKLITAIYADYARSLKNLGFKQGAVLFASKAGEAGKDLLKELESPKVSVTEDWQVICQGTWSWKRWGNWLGCGYDCGWHLDWWGRPSLWAILLPYMWALILEASSVSCIESERNVSVSGFEIVHTILYTFQEGDLRSLEILIIF